MDSLLLLPFGCLSFLPLPFGRVSFVVVVDVVDVVAVPGVSLERRLPYLSFSNTIAVLAVPFVPCALSGSCVFGVGGIGTH